MGWFRYKPYVPVHKRREQAQRKIAKMQKKGMDIQPISIQGRKITSTFWGNAWCDHIESFSDFDNRLPRGRTYVRNGSVCHLSISKGEIKAMVSGSELYKITIKIAPLSKKKWEAIKSACAGRIGSVLELLSGKLSDDVMKIVCDEKKGLFPQHNEIDMECDCLDWADLCKHLAAVLYGVGARLDHNPEQLFKLRGVNHEELIDLSASMADDSVQSKSKRKRIADSSLSDLFDLDLSSEKESSKSKPTKKKSTAKATKNQKAQSKPLSHFTGASFKKRRLASGKTQLQLAKLLSVTAATISRWENGGRKKLKLNEDKLKILNRLKG